ncbi:MAG: hypothetical protein K0S45_2197 [Nitrospira sp.]|jgi:hypothetical protein|nr:hypothetical protein [Nitrospira sp.]
MRKPGTPKVIDQDSDGHRLSSQAMKKRLRERLAADTQKALRSDIVGMFRKQGYYEELPLDELQDRLSKLHSPLADSLLKGRV